MATHITQQGGGFQSQRPRPKVRRVRERGSPEGRPRREPSFSFHGCIFNLAAGLAPGPVEYPGDCLSDTEALEGTYSLFLNSSLFAALTPNPGRRCRGDKR